MTNIARVFMYELVRNFRRKGYLFTTFGLPLLVIALFYGYQFLSSRGASSSANTTEAIAETVDTFSSRGVRKAGYVDPQSVFNGAESENLSVYTSQEQAKAALEVGEIDAVYVLAPDYAESGNILQIIPSMQPDKITNGPIEQLVFEQFTSEVDETLLNRLRNPMWINTVDLQREAAAGGDDVVRNEDTNFALAYGFAMLFMLTVFGTSGYLMQSVIEEKESRLVEILISSVRPVQLLSGKILAMGLLGLFQIAAWIGISLGLMLFQRDQVAAVVPFLTNLRIPLDALPILAIYFVLGYLIFAAEFGAIGAISNSLQEGPQFSIIFVLPALAPLFFLTAFVNDPNGSLPTFLSIFPFTSPMSMTMRSVITSVPPWQVALSIVLLALTVWVMFWIAGRLFRVQTLLAGKAPKMRELPGLIFGKS